MTFSSAHERRLSIALLVSWLGLGVSSSSGGAQAQPPQAESELLAGEAPLNSTEVVDVVVTAPRRFEERRSDGVLATEVIDRAQIETSGARDAAQALATQAGVQLDGSFAGTGVVLSGLEPQHTLIVVDGERLVGARDGVLDLSRFYAADIAQIELVRGPASAAYGSDAMAGVINIVTRAPRAELGGSVQGRYGATRGTPSFLDGVGRHGDAWASATGGGDHVRARASAGYRRIAFFDRTPETPSLTSGRIEQVAGNARMDVRVRDDVRVPLFLRVARREERTIDESASGAVYDRTQRTDDLTATLAPRVRFGGEKQLQLTASYARQRARYLRDQRGDDDGDVVEDAREQLLTARAQAQAPLASWLGLAGGLELLGQSYRSPRLEDDGLRGRASPFVELTCRFAERLNGSVAPSARVDLDSQFGVNVSPRLALRVDPRAWLALRASVGRGFRAPSFSELLLDFQNAAASYRVRGNPDLRPESSVGAHGSAELRASDAVRVTVSAFRNDLRDLIDTGLVEVVGGEQQFAYVNVRRARTQGAEATARLRAHALVELELGYAFTHARDLTADRPLSGRARHRSTARLVLGGGAQPWTLSARCQLAGKRAFAPADDAATSGVSAPAYVAVDARAAYRLADEVEPFVVAENLTDTRGPSLPLRPLTLYAGLNLSY